MSIYGNKIYKPYLPLFPTPTEIPLDSSSVALIIPSNPAWIGLWIGALLILTDPENFVQFEDGISRETTAEIFREALFDALLATEVLPAPYWDDPEGDDAGDPEDNPEFPFYEDVAVWAITGFVAYAAGIGAALQFWTVQKQFRIALRQSDIGGIVSLFMDGDLVAEVDTYSAAAPDLVYVDIISPGSTLRLEVTGKNPAVAGDPVTQLIRKRLSQAELVPPNVRWSEICLCVEVTFDGGITWVESPANDPRYGEAFRAPALTVPNARCIAAVNMVYAIRLQVDAAIDAANAVGLAAGLLGIITLFVPGFNVIVAVVTTVAAFLIGVGGIALGEAFTEETYDTLICIFYQNLFSDGQLSQEQFDAILDDVIDEFGVLSLQRDVIELMGLLLGSNGFSNAGALLDAEGECNDCCEDDDPFCHFWDFALSEGGWIPLGGITNAAEWVSGSGWETIWTSPNGRCYIERNFNQCKLQHLEFDYVGEDSVAYPNAELRVNIFDGATLVYQSPDASYSDGANTWSEDFDDLLCTEIQILLFRGADVTNIITSAQASGIGCPDFGADNC